MKFIFSVIVIITLICIVVLSRCNHTKIIKNDRKGSIEEQHFVLKNNHYKLNAVYTYINDGNTHPAVLLIAGSGPCDYDETIGALKPFKDIAIGLAKEGINSLRVDKRTFRYGADMDIKCGIEEEYLADCNVAIEYLKSQNISDLYLLGHSLGGQIAVEIASKRTEVDGIILFNSSARHLADIACAQCATIDPTKKFADAAKKARSSTTKGYYYYGASDYYWASYNQIDTANNIFKANVKTLIINSTNDKQLFEEDINMWKTLFGNTENISILVYDDISHFGYKVDTTNVNFMYKKLDFPTDLILKFKEFIAQK